MMKLGTMIASGIALAGGWLLIKSAKDRSNKSGYRKGYEDAVMHGNLLEELTHRKDD